MQVIEQLKRMSPERFLAIYTSLETNGYGPLDGDVAKALRFRPQAIRKVPMDQRARRARTIMQGAANAELAYELFGAYLIKHKKDLVIGFLDSTGVKHEDGMIEDVEHQKPSKEKLAPTIAELDEKHAPEDVTLYLAIAAEQWPSVPEIDKIWRERLERESPAAKA
jgi:hypothetical protein